MTIGITCKVSIVLCFVLLLLVGCTTSLRLPLVVTGKYKYADNTCALYMSDVKSGGHYTTTDTTVAYCSYEIGQEIK